MTYKKLSMEQYDKLQPFIDKWIGKDFFSKKDVEELVEQDINYVAFDRDKLVGVRFAYLPDCWESKNVSPDKWKVPREQVARGGGIFVHGDYQKKGIGKTLEKRLCKALKEKGAKAICVHSWLESPNNSSQKFLLGNGYKNLKTYKDYYINAPSCSRCEVTKENPCSCSANEMIKYLED